jgi:hypothetical protein
MMALEAVGAVADNHAAKVLPIIREIRNAGSYNAARDCRGVERAGCPNGARRTMVRMTVRNVLARA